MKSDVSFSVRQTVISHAVFLLIPLVTKRLRRRQGTVMGQSLNHGLALNNVHRHARVRVVPRVPLPVAGERRTNTKD